jgi:hypothetical protein
MYQKFFRNHKIQKQKGEKIMREIIEILIKRDGMVYEEAKNYTIEGMEEVMEMADI